MKAFIERKNWPRNKTKNIFNKLSFSDTFYFHWFKYHRKNFYMYSKHNTRKTQHYLIDTPFDTFQFFEFFTSVLLWRWCIFSKLLTGLLAFISGIILGVVPFVSRTISFKISLLVFGLGGIRWNTFCGSCCFFVFMIVVLAPECLSLPLW